MTTRDAFWRGVVAAALPLGIWALHFAGSYVLVAAGCLAGLETVASAGIPLLRALLVIFTLLAAAWLALLMPAAWRRGAQERFAFAGLGLVAVCWTLLPIVTLPVCGR